MNKMVFGIAVAFALVAALLTSGPVFAQDDTPVTPQAPGTMGMGGMRGGARGAGTAAVGSGILHDVMIAVYAETLNIPVDELNTRLAGGETLAQIALAEGLTYEQLSAIKADARSQAIDQAVADGTLTPEQAEWMKDRGTSMNGGTGRDNAGGRGNASGRGNAVGRGMGQRGTQDCPYLQTTP